MDVHHLAARVTYSATTIPISIDRISYSSASTFFEKYEHLGNCGLGVWHYGAFADSDLIGVISLGTACFSKTRGLISSVATQFGLGVYQLTRGGTSSTAPFNTPSRVLSSALNHFRRERGDCLVVAYADRAFNEVGTIYQACNGIYTGQTDPKGQANYIIRGRRMSGWLVRKRFGTRSMEALTRLDETIKKVPLS